MMTEELVRYYICSWETFKENIICFVGWHRSFVKKIQAPLQNHEASSLIRREKIELVFLYILSLALNIYIGEIEKTISYKVQAINLI